MQSFRFRAALFTFIPLTIIPISKDSDNYIGPLSLILNHYDNGIFHNSTEYKNKEPSKRPLYYEMCILFSLYNLHPHTFLLVSVLPSGILLQTVLE